MPFLRQSTAVDVGIGPFVDATDGVTAETGLTLAQADIRLKKNNGAWAQVNDNTSATHEENGWYEKELDATDTNTVGRLIIAVHESGALPVWHEFWVLEEAIYDALFAASATGALPVSSSGIASSAFATGAINAAAIASDAITAAKIADGAIDSATFAAGAITANAIAADAIGASELAADAVTEIQSGLATAAALTTVDTVVDAIQAKTDNLPSDPADASVIAGLIAAAEAKIDIINTNVDAILVDTGTTLDGKLDTIDTNVDAILEDTGTTLQGELDGIQADTEDIQSRLPAALTGGGNIKADVLAISGDTASADRLEALMDGLIVAQINGGTPTTTSFIADGFTEATDDHFIGRLITFLSGALSGQQTDITDYAGATQTFTVTALTEAPSNDDFFVIH